jgi:hypothetical protein
MNHRPTEQREHEADLWAWVIMVGMAVALIAFGVCVGMLLSLALE